MAGSDRRTRTRAPEAPAPTASQPGGGARRARAFIAHHRKISALVLVLFLAAIGTAVALGPQGGPFTNQTPTTFEGLAKVGPIDPQLHFPAWYRDHQATSLEVCVDPADANCLPPAGAHYDPARPLALDSTTPALNNFPDEFFYFNATSVLKPTAPVADVPTRLLVENTLEGAFANGAPILGDQMVFSRFRVKVDAGLQPNATYTIVHPYGTADVHTGAGENGFFVTQDIPLAALNFKGALNSRLGPYLTWDPATLPAAPAGYLGDPGIQHTISNSPVDNNYVALIGPGVGTGAPAANQCPGTVLTKFGASTGDCLYNDQFSLMGKKATRSGVDVTRSTYTRGTDGTTRLEVLAESNAGENILARDPDATLRVTPQRRLSATPLTDGGNGLYFAHILANAANANQLPDQVEVVNQSDVPVTIKDVPLVDTVSGTAIYDGSTTGPNLHVIAKSSDQLLAGANPVAALSVPTDAAGNPLADATSTITQALTPQTDGTQTWDFTVIAPPATVLVLSKQGGTVALPVDVSTAPDTPAGPLKAVAGADRSIVNGPLEPAIISLNGSESTGDITSYEWTGPYAVVGGVFDAAPDPALGLAPVNVPTGLYDATVAPPTVIGTYGYRLTVTGTGAPPTDFDDMVLTVTAGATAAQEIITPTRQLYRPDQTRWQIDGTDNIIAGNSITAHNGSSTQGAVIGAPSAIGTTGLYTVDTRDSGIVPELCTGDPANAANACVTLVSKLGNSVTLVVDTNGVVPVPAAPVAPAPAAPGLGAAPLAPLAPLALGAARVAVVPAFAPAALIGAGVPLRIRVPARARVLRIRVLTIPGKFRVATVASATIQRHELLRIFHKVTIAGKARTIQFRLRSRKLYASVRHGHSYTLEITPGLGQKRLGKPTHTTLRVR